MEMQRILMRTLAFMLFASAIWTVTGAIKEKEFECCKSVSKANVTNPIISVKMQLPKLPCVWAIIVETEKAERFCVDPGQPWVRRTVLRFFNKTRKTKQLTSTLQPTSPTQMEGSSEAPTTSGSMNV